MTSLGLEYVYAGQAAQAVAVLDRANRLQPGEGAILGNLGAAHLQLASIHLRQGQLVEAGSALQAGRVALSQALELMPGEAEWQKNLANLENLQRRLEEAK